MIELATKDDVQELVSIWIDISRKEFSQQIGSEAIEYFIESGEMEQETLKLIADTYVYRKNGCVAGFVVLIDNLIELVLVRTEFQNSVIGSRLYRFALKRICKEHGHVRAECFANNERANSILTRLRFTFDGSYEDDMGFVTNTYSKQCPA